eukprot:1074663-Karenia_brevis.AAC.1
MKISSGMCLPWVKLVRSDLQLLHSSVPEVRDVLPNPEREPQAWYKFIVDEPERFRSYIRSLSYVASQCDRTLTAVSDHTLNFYCELCPMPHPAFKSNKALMSHKRVCHGCRSEMRFYATSSGVCPACGTCFNTRLRLLAHLVDSRRDRCRNLILHGNFDRIPDVEVQRLDNLDKISRRDARRAGHTHELATCPARRADGRIIGRASS